MAKNAPSMLSLFGGGPTSGIHCRLVEKLRDYYGLAKRPVTVPEPYQMLGQIDDDLKDTIGIDTVPLWGPGTLKTGIGESGRPHGGRMSWFLVRSIPRSIQMAIY
ncbi:hypothetical protein CSA56_07735 [candidate division KSB3 bacterium]|uniref:Uncharacterized protein n=1 Tax=candidate division KSB3 bacterium TaxID=2044937 RepID=A0A2G6KFV8_9BACT|nr:MAG: hypothetical protein CSA56_07735 [candidate division KSB3 bacterium]